MNNMKIEIPKGCKAEWVNGVLTLIQDKKEDIRPVTERVKTFEDACNELGPKHPFVLQYKFNYNEEDGWSDNADTRDFSAYLKLRIITAALNGGWFADGGCMFASSEGLFRSILAVPVVLYR